MKWKKIEVFLLEIIEVHQIYVLCFQIVGNSWDFRLIKCRILYNQVDDCSNEDVSLKWLYRLNGSL